MFGALAKILIFALSLSLIVSITLVPSIFAKLSGGKKAGKMREKETPIFDKFSEIKLYGKFNKKLLSILVDDKSK